eukprot:TRINITY_DN1520_c0_g1_i3.p1 TRINITY_DN1520_c0_g1~~TRINITY_DN1520_c0_g1_i3.p1  ORF type:complete len:372 (+),score=94.38 TRINITY_DN1520_c0_g1_i3:502-1617(+)
MASERGHPGASYNLGVFYENGKGVKQSFETARKYYEMTVAAGEVSANIALERVKSGSYKLRKSTSSSYESPSLTPKAEKLGYETQASMVTTTRMIEPEQLQIMEVIGLGSFGKVEKCRYVPNQTIYAAKTFDLRKQQQDVIDFLTDSFLTELRILDRARHKNIVGLFGYCVTPESLIMVMDLYDTSLRKVLSETKKRRDYFHEAQLKFFCKDILEGVLYLHEDVGVAHRDLKTENILIRLKEGGRIESLHLADFGLSKVLERRKEEFLERANTMVGTVNYMAPEVASTTSTTPAYNPFLADVYCFGLIVHEMMTLELPNRSMKEVVDGDIPPLPKECEKNYPFLVPLVKECCQRVPAKRPSVKKILSALSE